MRILAAGDAAVRVSLPESIDPDVNAWCVALADAVRTELAAIARDVVVGYCTVTVYFDPARTDPEVVEQAMSTCASRLDGSRRSIGQTIDVPVCYDDEFAPDLGDVAAFGGCSEQEVIDRHTGGTYQVYVVGFVPGFAYLAAVDDRIAAPRRSTPRLRVPAGSVAIAGRQTGVYPSETPGGWNIIGRTPVKPFDPARRQPFLFAAGDAVRFHAVTRAEFEAIAASGERQS